MTDVIAEIAETSSDAPRDHRPAVRDAAQAAFEALFDVKAGDPAPAVDAALRHLLAARASWLEGDRSAADWYLRRLATVPDADAHPAAEDLIVNGPDGAAGTAASRRVRAALRYVDLLVGRPAAATADDLNALIVAGWVPADIVVIGQIVGFISYQVRVAHALRVQDELFGEDA